MSDESQDRRDDGGVTTRTRPRPRTEQRIEKPKLFKVLLHNDDYTTMEFVVHVLRHVFGHSEADAVRIMLHVHRSGIGVAGVFPFEFAETRAAQVETLARENEFPLRCTLEEA